MRILRIWQAQGRNVMAIQLQYRVALGIWMIGLVLQPVIYLVVWTTVSQANGSRVGTFTTRDFAGYFIVLMLVNHATFSWVVFGFDARVRMGAFSPLLLKPVHPIHQDLVENLSYKLLMLAVLAPATVYLVLVFRPAIQPAPWQVGAFVPALILAIALRFLVDWTVALAAFWTARMSAVDQMYYIAVLFLSGQIAPLSLFPGPVTLTANILPFRWMVAFPVELLLGRVSERDALVGLAVQCGWLAAALLGLRLLWRRGVARYSAVGA